MLLKALLGRDTVSASGTGRYKHLIQCTDAEDFPYVTLDSYEGAQVAGAKRIYRYVGSLINTLSFAFDANVPGGLVTADWSAISRYLTKLAETAGALGYDPTAVAASALKAIAAWRPVVTINLPGTSNVANEIQTLTLNGTPAGGTFTISLTYAGSTQTTSALAFDVSAAAMQTAIRALSNVGAGNANVTLSGTTYTIEFVSTLASTDIPQLIVDDSGLTGGTSPSITVVTLVNGRADPGNDSYFQSLTIDYTNNGERIMSAAGSPDDQGLQPAGRAATARCMRILPRGETETFVDLAAGSDTFDLVFDMTGVNTQGDGLDRIKCHAPYAEVVAHPPKQMQGGHKIEQLDIIFNRDDNLAGPFEWEVYNTRATAY